MNTKSWSPARDRIQVAGQPGRGDGAAAGARSMRILGHLHSFNDEEVIERSLQALVEQSRPLDEILLVDNGSTDRTLQRILPKQVTVIRHPENRGTSGAVGAGFQYAVENGFDWIWLLDADSAPRKDALEKLLELYRHLSPELQAQTWLLASLAVDISTQRPCHGITFAGGGAVSAQPPPAKLVYECDATIWTGSLYKLAAVKKIGLPLGDYFLDVGEYEYGYQGKLSGYRAFVHQGSVVEHNIDGKPGPAMRIGTYRFGPFSFKLVELPPFRCYYVFRNTVYFALHVYHQGNLARYLRALAAYPGIIDAGKFLVKLVLLARWPEIRASVRGLWDGFSKNLHRRY